MRQLGGEALEPEAAGGPDAGEGVRREERLLALRQGVELDGQEALAREELQVAAGRRKERGGSGAWSFCGRKSLTGRTRGSSSGGGTRGKSRRECMSLF